MATTLVFLPGEFHGQRSLAGYNPWGCKESDITEQLTLSLKRHHFLIVLPHFTVGCALEVIYLYYICITEILCNVCECTYLSNFVFS